MKITFLRFDRRMLEITYIVHPNFDKANFTKCATFYFVNDAIVREMQIVLLNYHGPYLLFFMFLIMFYSACNEKLILTK